MKRYLFTVSIEIPNCDEWNSRAENLKEIIQDRFDFESDHEGRWKVGAEEISNDIYDKYQGYTSMLDLEAEIDGVKCKLGEIFYED